MGSNAPVLRLLFGSGQFVGGLILFVISVVFLSIAGGELTKARRYQRAGIETDATVISKDMRPATADSGTVHEVSYRVITAEGESYVRDEAVDVNVWEKLEPGGRVRALYVPGDPGSTRLGTRPGTLIPLTGVVIALPLAALGAVLLTRAIAATLGRIRIYKHGQRADAMVTTVRQTNFRINKRPQWMIDFTYRDHTGQERRGSSHHLSPVDAQAWNPGDKGVIRFDPAQPERSVWVGHEH